MVILEIKENTPKKGQCTIEAEMSNEEMRFFIEYGFNEMLKESRQGFEKLIECRKCFNCGSEISEKVLKEYPDTEICGACFDGSI